MNLWPVAEDRQHFIQALIEGSRRMQTEARLRQKSGELRTCSLRRTCCG